MIATSAGRIATFYSYKGGTGRSMALANFAWILAANGKRVLTIDWDLEAPGLHRYFRPFLIDPDLIDTEGLIDTFWSFAASALESAQSATRDQPNYISTPMDDTKRRLNWKFPTGGFIDFVGAGRQGATYSERVNTFDWKRFYELGGAAMLNYTKAQLRTNYDWVLIDSRTGVSDTAGICTMQLPDTVITCFTLNCQSIDGVGAVMQSIRAFRSPSVDGSKIKFFPMATRIENAEKERLEIARTYTRNKLADFVPEGIPSGYGRSYWDDMEISYRPYYAFEEILSAFGDATGSTRAADTMLAQMEVMARRVAGDGSLQMPEILETDRNLVLAQYALGSASSTENRMLAGQGLPHDDGVTFDEDATGTEFLRGLLAKEQLWRKSKFSSRYLLSRRELDLLAESDRKQFGRNMTYFLANSSRGQAYFKELPAALLASVVLTLGAAFAIYVSVGREIVYQVSADPFRLTLAFGTIFALLWTASTALLAGFVLRRTDPPYNLGFADTFFRLLSMQISSGIHDFEPEEAVRQRAKMGSADVKPGSQ